MRRIRSSLFLVKLCLLWVLMVTRPCDCLSTSKSPVSSMRLFNNRLSSASGVLSSYQKLISQLTNSFGLGGPIIFDLPNSRSRNKRLERERQEKTMVMQASQLREFIERVPPRVGQVMMTEPLYPLASTMSTNSDDEEEETGDHYMASHSHVLPQSVAPSTGGRTRHSSATVHTTFGAPYIPDSGSILRFLQGPKPSHLTEKIKFMYPIRVLDHNTIYEPDEWHDSFDGIDSGAFLSKHTLMDSHR